MGVSIFVITVSLCKYKEFQIIVKGIIISLSEQADYFNEWMVTESEEEIGLLFKKTLTKKRFIFDVQKEVKFSSQAITFLNRSLERTPKSFSHLLGIFLFFNH